MYTLLPEENNNFLVPGTNVHEQSRSDFCRLRFKTSGYSKMYAISSNIAQPGATVYYSGTYILKLFLT